MLKYIKGLAILVYCFLYHSPAVSEWIVLFKFIFFSLYYKLPYLLWEAHIDISRHLLRQWLLLFWAHKLWIFWYSPLGMNGSICFFSIFQNLRCSNVLSEWIVASRFARNGTLILMLKIDFANPLQVMEQFFGLVNTFLHNHRDTRKRRLGVRTYKVPFPLKC